MSIYTNYIKPYHDQRQAVNDLLVSQTGLMLSPLSASELLAAELERARLQYALDVVNIQTVCPGTDKTVREMLLKAYVYEDMVKKHAQVVRMPQAFIISCSSKGQEARNIIRDTCSEENE